MRFLRSRRGQIVMPTMFILPSLMLFVYLIYETAKLSREKIRHQFAIDAAAFVEMTNYSDFLNRSAYVNGAFPMRIFREGFHDTPFDCQGRAGCPGPRPLDDILYDEGDFPRSISDPTKMEYTTETTWDIGYGMKGAGKNADPPDVPETLTMISMDAAKLWWINWEDANQIYKLYVQIYQLLGSVESAQYSVLKRLSAGHNFLKKSYWLNTGGPEALNEAADAVISFDVASGGFNSAVKFWCSQKMLFHGNALTHSWGQPYQIWASDPPPDLPSTISECTGLFQVVTVDRPVVRRMSDVSSGGYPGWPVQTRWTAPNNYFSIDFNRLMPEGRPLVHATVSIGYGPFTSVWPNPTPKYQVRLFP